MAEAIPLALTVFGSVMKAGSEVRAGKAEQDLANYNASIEDFNARSSDAQATDALLMGAAQATDARARGVVAEDVHRKGVAGLIGSQRAAQGGSGIDVNSGSNLDVQADSAHLGELDAITIRTNAAREAWGFDMNSQREAAGYRADATASKMRGEYYRKGGKLAATTGRNRAVSTIIGTAGELAYQQYGKKREG